jgi:hypothetical protein
LSKEVRAEVKMSGNNTNFTISIDDSIESKPGTDFEKIMRR